MAGAGNDFIVIDGRNAGFKSIARSFLRKVCTRSLSVGADGVIVILPSRAADFKVRFYNPDGSISRFCGNGSRCASMYAHLNGLAKKKLSFEGDDGIHHAIVSGKNVSVSIADIKRLKAPITVTAAKRIWRGGLIDVGVPHFVTEVANIEDLDVEILGRKLRHHKRFFPAGANVDFIRCEKNGSVTIRTYERGVERETLSCGSGCVAASVYVALMKNYRSPIIFHTRSSVHLKVSFEEYEGRVQGFFLEGDARIIFKGDLHGDALSGFSL